MKSMGIWLGKMQSLLTDHVMPNGIFHQFGVRLDTQDFHCSVLVKGYRAGLELKDVCDFLHRLSLRQQLQHFALAGRNLLFVDDGCTSSEKEVNRVFGDKRG